MRISIFRSVFWVVVAAVFFSTFVLIFGFSHQSKAASVNCSVSEEQRVNDNTCPSKIGCRRCSSCGCGDWGCFTMMGCSANQPPICASCSTTTSIGAVAEASAATSSPAGSTTAANRTFSCSSSGYDFMAVEGCGVGSCLHDSDCHGGTGGNKCMASSGGACGCNVGNAIGPCCQSAAASRQFPSKETAQKIAACTGGTVEELWQGGPFQWINTATGQSVPMYMVKIGSTSLSAGLIADMYQNHAYDGAYVDGIINRDLGFTSGTTLLGTNGASIPSVFIDFPKTGTSVFGVVPIAGWAIDNQTTVGSAITSVKLYVDGKLESTAAYGGDRPDVCATYPGRPGCPKVGFGVSWDSTKVENGPHTIEIRATDADNPAQTGVAKVTLNIARPKVFIDFPKTNTIVSGVVDIAGWAVDNDMGIGSAIADVKLYVDGKLESTAAYGGQRPDVCTTYPGRPGCPKVGFGVSWDSTKVSDGPHVIEIRATNTSSITQTGVAKVTLNVTRPAVSCVAPGAGSTVSSNKSGIDSFRYMRIDDTETGWNAFREIEAYDTDGNKLSGTATASSVYQGNWQSPPISPQGPEYAVDGNTSTAWNAGETNPGCNAGRYGPECPSSSRSAWIKVDYGQVRNVSMIRLLDEGWTLNESVRVMVSDNDKTYRLLKEFKRTGAADTYQYWMEYPETGASSTTSAARPQGIFILPGQATTTVGSVQKFNAWFDPGGAVGKLQNVTSQTTFSSSDERIGSFSSGSNAFSVRSTGTVTVRGSYNNLTSSAQLVALTALPAPVIGAICEEEAQAFCRTFTMQLKLGMSHAQVVWLREVLAQEGLTSAGTSQVFDANLERAVIDFQEKYKDEILTPQGLDSGTGYVGSATIRVLNRLYGCDQGEKDTKADTSAAKVSLIANKAHGYLSAMPGDTINYSWTGTNIDSLQSSYTMSPADLCSGGGQGNRTGPLPWVAKTTSGSASAIVQKCQGGVTYRINLVGVQNSTGKQVKDELVVTVGGTGSDELVPTPSDKTTYSLSILPTTRTVSPGASDQYDVRAFSVTGSSGPVTLSLLGLPTGITGTFADSYIIIGQTTKLTLSTATSVANGFYPITLVGRSDRGEFRVMFSLNVTRSADLNNPQAATSASLTIPGIVNVGGRAVSQSNISGISGSGGGPNYDPAATERFCANLNYQSYASTCRESMSQRTIGQDQVNTTGLKPCGSAAPGQLCTQQTTYLNDPMRPDTSQGVVGTFVSCTYPDQSLAATCGNMWSGSFCLPGQTPTTRGSEGCIYPVDLSNR